MSDKFQNKYRIPSTRLQHWDYRWAGAYFITICTKDRQHYFGAVKNGKMILSNVGVLADVFWHEIKNHAKNVELGAFVVMPNHIHGILILAETLHATSQLPPPTSPLPPPATSQLPPPPTVETNEQMANISPKSGSVSAIVRSYKSAVTRHANRLGFEFGWQTRFHDHIIRDARSFDTISTYIINNPLNWDKDKFHGKT